MGKLVIPGHTGPAKAITWIDLEDSYGTFASTSHDQVVMLYHWNIETNAVELMNALKGHERSVDCISVDPGRNYLATGGYDNNMKIWGAKLVADDPNEIEEDKEMKRIKGQRKAVTRTPLMTLAAHKEGVSGITFTDSAHEVITSSYDHTIKIWDTQNGGYKSEIVGDKSFFDVSWSPVNRAIITASADRFIRLYDPREAFGGGSALVKATFTSHKGWVTCVDWNKERDYFFISGSHDNVLKMWDSRSCRTPLYDLTGHTDRILSCDWTELDTIVSGGADSDMKIFKSNVA